jgi:hypothetical protein
MPDTLSRTVNSKPRILMLSQRNINPYDAWRTPHYEFEDIICQLDSVELLAPPPGRSYKKCWRFVRKAGMSMNMIFNPGTPKIQLSGDYDMIFLLCAFPRDLLNFRFAEGWKDHCRTSICMIDEIWAKSIPRQRAFMPILSKFDHIVLYYSQSVKPVHEATDTRCHFLPPGIDTLKFCPYPNPPQRTVDVYSIGRRSQITHQKLLELVKEKDLFYIYDTVSGSLRVTDRKEHRELFANTAKRSRFFLVNPGLIDAAEKRGDQIEIGNRYFEGAASGCIMIGEIPKNGVYENLFNWPDAVIPLPFGSDKIGEIIDELDRQPDREEAIRKNNITHSLRRHDWAYRWESLLDIGGLEPLPGLLKRKEQLERLAISAEEDARHSGTPTTGS